MRCSPVLLVRKAAAKRRATGDKRYQASLERQNVHWKARFQRVLGRPFKVLFLEPVLIVLTIYMSVSVALLWRVFFFPLLTNPSTSMESSTCCSSPTRLYSSRNM